MATAYMVVRTDSEGHDVEVSLLIVSRRVKLAAGADVAEALRALGYEQDGKFADVDSRRRIAGVKQSRRPRVAVGQTVLDFEAAS